jgi:putative molybdopterin biosynthesis protein
VKDKPEKIKEPLLKAAENSDMIVINADYSTGRKDFTVQLISENGRLTSD